MDKDTIRGYKESARVKWCVKVPAMLEEVIDYVNSYCGYCSLGGCDSCHLKMKGVCNCGDDSAFSNVFRSLKKAIKCTEQMGEAIEADIADDEGGLNGKAIIK